MSRVPGRVLAIFVVAWRRLWANRWLSLAELAGFVAVVALALSVPLYADAVYHRILSQTLGLSGPTATRLPAFAFMFRYVLYTSRPVAFADIQPADRFVDEELPALMELPRTDLVRYFQTTNFRVFLDNADGQPDDRAGAPLLRLPLTSVSHFDEHVRIIDGRLPAETAETETPVATAGETIAPVEVLVSKALAERAGLAPGERLFALSGQSNTKAVRVPVIIAGTWEPNDPYEVFWFYRPGLMENMLIVPEATFVQRLAPNLQKELAEILWYANFDGSAVRVWDVAPFIERIRAINTRAGSETGGIALNLSVSASPLDRLLSYQQDSQTLMVRLYTLSLPIFVLAFAFVILIASQRALSQRNEAAVLRSRGATQWQVLGIACAQLCMVAVMAVIVATVPAALGAQFMGRTRSFFQFTGTEWLPVAITPASLTFGLIAAAASMLIALVPMIDTARHTVIRQKQERARTLRPPWWQRAGIDLLLLIPVGYWTYLLHRQGYVDLPGLPTLSGDMVNNPSLFIVAALGMLGLTLLFIRLLPLALRVCAQVLSLLPGTSTVLAFRQLARSPSSFTAPVLLLTLTLALAIFTASLAATLDRQLDEETFYSVGADARLVGIGHDNRAQLAGAQSSASSSTAQGGPVDFAPDRISGRDKADSEGGPRWLFLPISDYTKASGVRAATRVGRYAMTPQFSAGDSEPGQFIGIDRTGYAQATFWRRDFAVESLGALLNALGSAPDGVLLPESTMQQHALSIGDVIPATVALPDTKVQLTFKVVGTYRRWPTWDPGDTTAGPAFVGNLDYLFEYAGGQAPHDVWLALAPGAGAKDVEQQLREIDRSGWDFQHARDRIEREHAQPQRQGLFGMLSAGVITAVLLTVFGLFLYYAFSFRRRFIEFGVLRAIGLSTRQMALSLSWELAILFVAGIGIGTALGFGASRIYLPLLQGPATTATPAVPLIVMTDQLRLMFVYAAVLALSAIAVALLLVLLRRLRIFQAIKLGEAE